MDLSTFKTKIYLLTNFLNKSIEKVNNTDVVGNNVKIINCSCNGKNKCLSPSATQYSPLSNDGQEKPSSAMQN